MKTKYLSLYSLLFFISCSQNNDIKNLYTNESTSIINIQEDLKQISHLDSVFNDVTFLPLETKEECLISRISTLKISDSLIFINDNRRRLLIFGKDGKFKIQIGQSGEGPGEFLDLKDFIINKDNIEILDFKKIETYNFEGKHLSTKRFDLSDPKKYCNPDHFNHSPLGGYYLWGGTFGIKEFGAEYDRYMMYHVNNDFKIQKGYFLIEHGAGSSHNRFTKYNDNIIIDPHFGDYNIYQIDNKGIVSSRYFLNFGKNAYRKKIPIPKKNQRETYEDLSNYVLSFNDFFETDKWLHLTFQYQNTVFSALYNKEKEKCFLLSAANKNLKPDEIRYWGAYTITKDQLVMPIEANWLKIEFDRLSPKYMKKINLNQYKDIKESDNPVLVFYKLK